MSRKWIFFFKMGVPAILFQNYRGIVPAYFPDYQTSDRKCRKNSYFAIFRNEPELSMRHKIMNFSRLKL